MNSRGLVLLALLVTNGIVAGETVRFTIETGVVSNRDRGYYAVTGSLTTSADRIDVTLDGPSKFEQISGNLPPTTIVERLEVRLSRTASGSWSAAEGSASAVGVAMYLEMLLPLLELKGEHEIVAFDPTASDETVLQVVSRTITKQVVISKTNDNTAWVFIRSAEGKAGIYANASTTPDEATNAFIADPGMDIKQFTKKWKASNLYLMRAAIAQEM